MEAMTSETRTCKNCKAQFTIEPEDLIFYEKLDLPAPNYCRYCLWKYLLAFWIFGRFRITNSALSGKKIITVLPEAAPFPIYEHAEFISDRWDPTSYGQYYNSSRSFIEQLIELQSKVPHPHQTGIKNLNCDWCDDIWESKESYLTRSALRIENVSYGYRVFESKNSIDLTYSFKLERSYDCLYCFKSYHLQYSFNARDCVDSVFLYDCRNCQNCFMCWNLRNKNYCIRNKQYSKEKYFEELGKINLRSYSVVENLKKEFWEHIRQNAVHRAHYNTRVVNSYGNFLTEDKNCFACYFFEQSENCRYCFRGIDSKENIYIIGSVGEKCGIGTLDQWGYGNVCCLYATYCRWSAYLDNCEECEYCFGCVGLRKKKYCILNKQYSKEEYERLISQIKGKMKRDGEWGKFWPLTSAYAGYNYSLGQMNFPMTKAEALNFGARWEEPVTAEYSGVSGDDLPDTIDDVKDEIVKQRIICPETKLSYNIASHELVFYREHGIPLPRRHFDWRTLNRFRPMTLMVYPRHGICTFCNKEIEHYYAPELGYKKIACVECYQREIA